MSSPGRIHAHHDDVTTRRGRAESTRGRMSSPPLLCVVPSLSASVKPMNMSYISPSAFKCDSIDVKWEFPETRYGGVV